MKSYLGSLICRFKGHKFRRLRKGERPLAPSPQHRICDRCGIFRAVKPRKKAAA